MPGVLCQQRAGLHLSPPRHSIRTCATDLRQQQAQLVSRVARDPSLPSIQEAVLQGARALQDSRDWQQLQSVFAAAVASQQRRPNAGATPASPRSGGGWGFALRQPGSRPGASSDCNSDQPSAGPPVQQQNQAAVPWEWQTVRHFHMLGLGSITALAAAQPRQQHSNTIQQQASPSSRLGFRLMQLTLAVALRQQLLPGLSSRPAAFDPEFEPADIQLLQGLGWTVPDGEPSHVATGPTLYYMPCCPRQLYSDVLAANWGQLQQVAILGTSMSSLSNTQSLFTALVAESEGGPQSTQGSSPAGGAQQGASLGQQQADMVSLAYSQGRVVEMPCPDCGAHGVGVSLHMFR